MNEFNKDILLGSAIQLIKDIHNISFLGESMECLKINQMTKMWLQQVETTTTEKEGAE